MQAARRPCRYIQLQYKEYISIIQKIRTKYKTKIFIKFKSVNRNISTTHNENIVVEEHVHPTTHILKLRTTKLLTEIKNYVIIWAVM